MKGFIEVTKTDAGQIKKCKVLINVNHIFQIMPAYNGTCAIDIIAPSEESHISFIVDENYEEVVKLVKEAQE